MQTQFNYVANFNNETVQGGFIAKTATHRHVTHAWAIVRAASKFGPREVIKSGFSASESQAKAQGLYEMNNHSDKLLTRLWFETTTAELA